MATFKLNVSWSVGGVMEVEADTYEEAVEIAINDEPLPTQSEYISDSFRVDGEVEDDDSN